MCYIDVPPQMYSVVEFTEENSISVVPTNWLYDSKRCYWPPTGTQYISKLVKQMCSPNEKWRKLVYKLKKKNSEYKPKFANFYKSVLVMSNNYILLI